MVTAQRPAIDAVARPAAASGPVDNAALDNAALDEAPLDEAGRHAARLAGMGEPFAAGYLELPGAAPVRRWSRAVRRRFEARTAPTYAGQPLYPAGRRDGDAGRILTPSYSFTWSYDDGAVDRARAAANPAQAAALTALQQELRSLSAQLDVIDTVHTVGGRGYTHSIPNYGRVLREGLEAHAARVEAGLQRARADGDREATDLYLGLGDVLAGIRAWHGRLLAGLRDAADAAAVGTEAERSRRRLLAALERVPWRPARGFLEAVVAYNLVYYLDDCDNPGRVDLELAPYYEADLAAGATTRAEALRLIGCLWRNCDANDGWSAGIGGTDAAGGSAHSALTEVCLEAARGLRRPNLQLHVRRDTSAAVWDTALQTIATGCGLPALYHEEAFLESLRAADLGIAEADLALYNGGGCTETMIHGLSNVGSLDAGLHLPLILVETLRRELPTAASFADLWQAYLKDVTAVIDDVTRQVSADQAAKARLRPQPMRSLLIDDCIDAGTEFNAGGARYNWSVINVAGLATTVDSLAAVRQVVFEAAEVGGAELQAVLEGDFDGREPLRRRLARCPRFGNGETAADGLAVDLAEHVFGQLLARRPWRGGRFLPSCLMFVTYARAGADVGATPDGRRAGEPIADSAGPHQGRDRHGPTAMLGSVAGLPQQLAPGTLVVNARFSQDLLRGPEERAKLRDLVRGYFDLGGMQLQINVVDQAVLEDAIAHPERHEDLIVRVGGYSEYFHRLSPELKQTLLERTEHAL